MRTNLPPHVDGKHCMLHGLYAVYTPPMHKMIETIASWIEEDCPGGYIYGASRFGKSRTVRWHLQEELEERFEGTLPLVIWTRRPDIQYSEADFWNKILLASCFQFASEEKPPKKPLAISLCKQRFIAIAESTGTNHIYLLIDEAQALTSREWTWLLGMQNALDDIGYQMTLFSVGSHQLGYRHEDFGLSGNAHIAARFMAAHEKFHGLRSVEELSYVLNGYDIESDWPPGSKVSFLKHFAPSDFYKDRRLAESSEQFWSALKNLTPNSAKQCKEYPMQHVAKSIESTLMLLARGEDWKKAVSYEGWLRRLNTCNFSDHMRIVSLPI